MKKRITLNKINLIAKKYNLELVRNCNGYSSYKDIYYYFVDIKGFNLVNYAHQTGIYNIKLNQWSLKRWENEIEGFYNSCKVVEFYEYNVPLEIIKELNSKTYEDYIQ